ncbi:hypothetical protein N7931_15490 [Catenovulum sp. 2E275]|uniref:hypothetical protein n=1 Tax=Catenovulum sp. 2E275 TaxID=2980497 RepID=UPI0021CFFE6B|nr:hypothetical protein [Catenovulum sp. 2E275]MCU4677036.1 hypothetical protein [Catenovulum sp. 2E275]
MKMLDPIAENLTEVITDLVQLRIKADLTLLPKYPTFGKKIYPLGRCLEIRDEVFELLKTELQQPKTAGLIALTQYIKQGNELTKIWGGLRDLYFQNAMKVGEYYIDVSNDTVNPNKPRVEVLLYRDAGFKPIEDFEYFCEIAEKYWHVKLFKNSVCSSLAPFMPVLCVDNNNKSWLAANDIMIQLARASQFIKSEQILNQLAEPSEQIKLNWQAQLKQANKPDLNNKMSPQAYCQLYREQKLDQNLAFRNQMVSQFISINKPV